MTFADLRKQMTPPTAEQVADALKAELRGLAQEFMPRGDAVPFFGAADHYAERLALAVLRDLAGKDSPLDKLLRAYRAGATAAFPVRMVESDIYNAADDFMAVAEEVADDWRNAWEAAA